MYIKDIIFYLKYYMEKLWKKLTPYSTKEEIAYIKWQRDYMEKFLEEQKQHYFNELKAMRINVEFDDEAKEKYLNMKHEHSTNL